MDFEMYWNVGKPFATLTFEKRKKQRVLLVKSPFLWLNKHEIVMSDEFQLLLPCIKISSQFMKLSIILIIGELMSCNDKFFFTLKIHWSIEIPQLHSVFVNKIMRYQENPLYYSVAQLVKFDKYKLPKLRKVVKISCRIHEIWTVICEQFSQFYNKLGRNIRVHYIGFYLYFVGQEYAVEKNQTCRKKRIRVGSRWKIFVILFIEISNRWRVGISCMLFFVSVVIVINLVGCW